MSIRAVDPGGCWDTCTRAASAGSQPRAWAVGAEAIHAVATQHEALSCLLGWDSVSLPTGGQVVSGLHHASGDRRAVPNLHPLLLAWWDAAAGDRKGREENAEGLAMTAVNIIEVLLPVGKMLRVRSILRRWREGLKAGD